HALDHAGPAIAPAVEIGLRQQRALRQLGGVRQIALETLGLAHQLDDLGHGQPSGMGRRRLTVRPPIICSMASRGLLPPANSYWPACSGRPLPSSRVPIAKIWPFSTTPACSSRSPMLPRWEPRGMTTVMLARDGPGPTKC